MTIPASGTISMQTLNTEVGSNQNNLNASILRALSGVTATSTLHSFNSFYSKTGKVSQAITLNSSTQSVGFNTTKLMNGTCEQLLRNAANGNCELDFNAKPKWQGNYTITNNTTGISSTLTRQNSVSWQGSNPANLLRASTSDTFTIIAS